MHAPRIALERSERVVLIGCAVVVLLVGAAVAGHGPLAVLEEHLYQSVRLAYRYHWVYHLGNVGMARWDVTAMGCFALAACLRGRSVLPLVYLAVTYASISLVVLVLKAVIGRPSPGPHMGHALDGSGFYPSGHTAGAAGFAMSVVFLEWFVRGRDFRVTSAVRYTALAVGSVVGLAVGAATVMTLYHWPTDVLGGLAVAVGVLIVTTGWLRAALEGQHSGTPQPAHPRVVSADPRVVSADPRVVSADPRVVSADPTFVHADPGTDPSDE
jgi:undecaprenyl-diphosphatase